jgi:hypothetical protein
MLPKRLDEEVELLRAHLSQDEPDPDFIERHAMAIIHLARALPISRRPERDRVLDRLLQHI